MMGNIAQQELSKKNGVPEHAVFPYLPGVFPRKRRFEIYPPTGRYAL